MPGVGNAVGFGELKKPSPEGVEPRAAVDRELKKTERPHNDSNVVVVEPSILLKEYYCWAG